MRTTTERGYGAAWQRLRRDILKRDKGLCQSCLQRGRYTQAKEVDHIQRKADGGTDAPSNLQCLCKPCHASKTRIENGGRDIACTAEGLPLDPQHHWNS